MGMEISASRLLAPFFGTSLLVWTNIIAVVMLALSLGYYWGGKLADKKSDIQFLLKTIFIAGCLFLAVPWIMEPLFDLVNYSDYFLSSGWGFIFIGSLFASLLILAVPIGLLGITTPYVIKLLAQEFPDEIGEMSGKIFAVSTIGSILGTFLPTLLLIPFVGTKWSITFFAMLLLVLSVPVLSRKVRTFFGISVILFLAIFSTWDYFLQDNQIIFKKDSPYQLVQVKQDSSLTNYLVFNEGVGIQSVYNEKNILTGQYYYDYFNVLPALLDENKKNKVLILGLAGGTIARQLNHFWEDQISLTGVEIDQVVIDAGKKHFGLEKIPVEIHNEDALVYLKQNKSQYDLIIVDAYQQEMYIPWTMTTNSFWNSVKEHLTDTGLVVLNINASSKEADLKKVMGNTMASVFEKAYEVPAEAENSSGWNYMLIGARNDLDFSKLKKEQWEDSDLMFLAHSIERRIEEINYEKELAIFTNDWAPVEFFTDKMILQFLLN